MEQQQQQQQQGTLIHRSVLYGFERLSDPRYHREQRQKLYISAKGDGYGIDRRSFQHVVDFLDNDDSHEVTELQLFHVDLVQPSDGGLEVLRTFFSRSDTTLTKIMLGWSDFGTFEETMHLLAAFQTNRTVTDLAIIRAFSMTNSLKGAALGACFSGLMQNMPQLQRLDCGDNEFDGEDGVRSLVPGIRNNHTLKELHLFKCDIGDGGIRLIADALVGNTTMEVLDISSNDITSVGLDDITRIIESTQVKTLKFSGNRIHDINNEAHRHFLTILRKNATIQELEMPYSWKHVPELQNAATLVCARNPSLAHADFLLAPLTLQHQQPHPSNNNGTTTTTNALMWIKTCHEAIVKFAKVKDNAGVSAIFKLFTASPQLLEKRLQRPPPPAALATATAAAAFGVSRGPQHGGEGDSSIINNNSSSSNNHAAATEAVATLNPSPKRKSSPSTTEQASKQTRHHAAGDGPDVDKKEVVDTTSTTAAK